MDVRKLTESSEQFLETDQWSEGGRYWQMERVLSTLLGRVLSLCTFFTEFSMHGLLKPSPPAMWGQESECCPGLDHCQGSGWPRRRAQAPALRHSLPPLPLHSEGIAQPRKHRAPLWEDEMEEGVQAVHREKQASTQDPRRHKERSQTQQPDEAEWTGEKHRTFSKVLIFF